MQLALARFISSVSNPLFFVLLIPFLLIYRETSDRFYAFKWMMFSSLYLLLVGLFVLYEVRRRVFSDLDISKREQRPLFFTFVFFVGFTYLLSLYLLQGPVVLYIAIAGILGSVAVLALVNRRIKASIHVASSTAFFATIALLFGGQTVFLLGFIPVVAWSRVKIKRHSTSEVIVGFALGLVLTLIVYSLVQVMQALL